MATLKVQALRRVLFVASCLLFSHHVQNTHGLRGCSSFGHSCFGAHGKRTELDVADADTGIKAQMSSAGSESTFDQAAQDTPFSTSQLAALAMAKGYSPAFLRLLNTLASGAEQFTRNESQ